MTLPVRSRRRWAALGFAAVAVTVAAAMTGSASASAAVPAEGEIRNAGGATAVDNSYLVVFKDSAVSAGAVSGTARQVAGRFAGSVGHTYQHALRGFELRGNAQSAARIAALPSVAFVEQNHTVSLAATQSPTPSWGLDRIDQRNLPLNNSYTYPTTAAGVRAYIIDTGIRFTHTDFGGRAVTGYDAIDGGSADDCHGHGTHVAGTTGGTAYGVAKATTLVGVRVLNCSGSGTFAQIVAGVDWVTGDHDPTENAVANMSLGGSGSNATLETAVTNSINDGVTYALAAGNSNSNACNFTPARTPAAITVGATESNDARASYSNYGTCLDIFAPGSGITSAWSTSDTATNTISGTSMASPHVAGVAALLKAQNPSWTPAQIRNEMVADATPGVVTNPGTGSPNLLLYVDNGGAPPVNDFSIAVSPTSGSTAPGGSVSATVSTTTTSGSAQSVSLSASGLPSGASATFSPSTVTSGGSSSLTISTSTSTPAGTYPITITGTGTSATRTTGYSLTVTGTGGGCSGTNGTDVSIPDWPGAAVTSSIAISNCNRNASATSTIAVNIIHTFRGDLRVELVAPDGSVYLLKAESFWDSADNVITTYTRNLSTEAANGTWRLRVVDTYPADVGYINSWTLTL